MSTCRMLLTATATVALLGMAASGASAFDKVDWRWDKHVDEWVDIDVKVDTHVYPDGVVEVEKIQAHFGNVNAYATVKDINNNLEPQQPAGTAVTWPPPPPPVGPDAKDLPKIENTATAVANNQSITSDVPILLHDAQFAAGDLGFDRCTDWTQCAYLLWGNGQYGNTHTDIAVALTLGGIIGAVQQGEVKAEAKVSNILNAFVENSATAVVNNASFTVESDKLDNHVVIADLTQWSYADVRADAQVEYVSLNGYQNLGEECFGGGCLEITPIISNTATAVGNNLSITVGVPAPSEP